MNKKTLKKEYLKLQNRAREISNTYDLMSLIRIGLPVDEYDMETDKIISQLHTCNSPIELAQIIVTVYNKMFDVDFKIADKIIMDFATEIYKLKITSHSKT